MISKLGDGAEALEGKVSCLEEKFDVALSGKARSDEALAAARALNAVPP